MERKPRQIRRKNRSANWIPAEKILLRKLVRPHLSIIENKRTDSETNHKKREAWNALCNRKCNAKHHSLLHFGNEVQPVQSSTAAVAINQESEITEVLNSLELEEVPRLEAESDQPLQDEENPAVSFCSLSAAKPDSKPMTQVLATAQVYATGRNGKDVMIRCLIDPGSQKHYITSKCRTRLGLNIESSTPITVKGIGGASQIVKGSVNVSFRSRFNDSKFCIQALVLNQITSDLPTCPVDKNFLNSMKNIPMADDTWGTPGEIDLLLGVSLFAEMLRPGKVTGEHGFPDALETVLGYIILGDAPTASQSQSMTSVACHAVATCEIESLVRKMWELDEIDSKHILSTDDKQCEDIYTKNVTRDDSGRYEVALPFKFSPDLLGNSLETAKRRFSSLQRKFSVQPDLERAYDNVIQDYMDQGYLSTVTSEDMDGKHFYIPHHAVLRDDKTSTRVRPVLDASAKSSSGFSLNDLLHTGPNLQRDLFTILLNMRLFPIAISADIRQMYLQIGVRPQDRRFQRILYHPLPSNSDSRDSSVTTANVNELEFNRVAFGLKCSPFLALRTVSQLAQDEGNKYPVAKEIVYRDLYMDDVASSLINAEQAITASQELIQLFKAGGFDLVKWSSNSQQILEQIPKDSRLLQDVEFNKDDTLKILGLCWYPVDDEYAFKVTTDDRTCTKRNILSSVARLFDVLGLVAPIILYAKLLIKELWIAKIGWDDVPPQRIIRLWNQFHRELPEIAKLRFPRHIGVVEDCSVTIIGFADASEKAYGAMVYIRVDNQHDQTTVMLSCAKSKVAPLKIVSLARLELCAALLLSIFNELSTIGIPRTVVNLKTQWCIMKMEQKRKRLAATWIIQRERPNTSAETIISIKQEKPDSSDETVLSEDLSIRKDVEVNSNRGPGPSQAALDYQMHNESKREELLNIQIKNEKTKMMILEHQLIYWKKRSSALVPPVPIIPIVPSVNTCMTLVSCCTTLSTTQACIPTVSTSQLQALHPPTVTTAMETVNPVSNPVMNSLVSASTVILNDAIPNPIIPMASSNINIPAELPVSTLPVPILGLKTLLFKAHDQENGDKSDDTMSDKPVQSPEGISDSLVNDSLESPSFIEQMNKKEKADMDDGDQIIVDDEKEFGHNGVMSIGETPPRLSPSRDAAEPLDADAPSDVNMADAASETPPRLSPSRDAAEPLDADAPSDVKMADAASENGSMQVEPSHSPLSTDMMVEAADAADTQDE
ncbi:unnamed protein product [Plutella xylostella]|uniref:Regulatory protein zeste n=1 Tax=Plutella xylostella TaxID=51655 RepID=A0A8S4ESM9_PLUXY|nr:unnamed protein product [Plutella xylostella]